MVAPKLAKPGIATIAEHMVAAGDDGLPPLRVALNSNESAFGPSPGARDAIASAARGIERYIDDPGALLAPAIAASEGLDAARIVIGQGSDDLLARLARAYLGPGTTLLRCATGYLKVPNYAHANDAEPVAVPGEGFRTSVDALLAAVTERTRMVYLANPENPSGTWLTGSEVRRLHAGLPDNVLLVIDGAYEDYVDDPAFESGARLVEDADNVVLCRTFSKAHGLAGARIGWMYGPAAICDAVRRIGLTFPVANPSVAAALASLADPGHVERVVAETRRLRSWLSGELETRGLTVVPSQGNFVLAGFPGIPGRAAACARALREDGIAVRRFAAPAYDDWLRVTIGPMDELAALLKAVDDALAAARA
ncbi:MAG: aminotransferase class I/II-fold pyridoxal phosphate-dependent enzyme [Rhodobacteraceae bacterium]|nr:aminotransferase class I/II-fold pyridoxal phosphate-dependent enzyme [Paracoccaceae bacterium]